MGYTGATEGARWTCAPTVDEPDLKIARVTLTGRRGNTSILDFDYLVRTNDNKRS